MAKKKKKERKQRDDDVDNSGIPTMVAALVKHKKFKAMAKYSLNTMVESIKPGHSGWEDNVSALVKNGGIEAIRDIIKQHPGDEEILELCSFALSVIPKHEISGPKYAKQLVEAGAVKVTLNSMKENAQLKAGVDNAMSLLETCAERNAEAMSAPDHVQAVLDVTRVFADNAACLGPCHRTLEKICRTPAGKAQFVAKGGVAAVLANMTPGRMHDENTLPVMNLLDRLCRDPANIEGIKNAGGEDGGISALLCVLDNSTSEEVTNVGARVINKIAGAYLDEFLQKLEDPSIQTSARDHYLRIVANLAIDPRNAAKIRSSNALAAMVGFMKARDVSAIALPSIPNTFERCVNTDADAAIVIAAGAIEGLVMGLQVYDANSVFVAAGVRVISALCTSEAHIAQINAQGGVTQVVRNVANHPEHPDVAVAVCRMIVSCADKGYNAGYFAATGGIPALVASMSSASLTPELAAEGAEGLGRMALSHRSYLDQVASSGGISACVRALDTHGDVASVTLNNFNLMATLAQEPSYHPYIESEGGITALISGMYAHSTNADVQEAGKAAIRLLVSDETVRRQVAALTAAMNTLKGSQTEPNAQAVEMVLVGLAAFSSVGAETIMAVGGVDAMVDALAWISAQRKLPRKDELLVAAFRALNELGQDPSLSSALHTALKGCNGLQTVVSTMKANVKVNTAALAGCNLLGSVAKLESAHGDLIENGAVQAVASAIAKHTDHVDIVNSGISCLATLASRDFGATSVFKSGGVRAAVKLLNSKSVKSEEYRTATLKSLRLLYRGAVASEDSRTTIQDGGGVEACINAMQQRPGDDEVADAAIAAATELLTEEDAARVVADLKELLALSGDKLAKSKNLYKMAGLLSMFGIVAASEKFAPILAAKGGIDALVKALKTLHGMPESEAREIALNAGIAALGQMSRHAQAAQYAEAIPVVLAHLDASRNAGCLLSVERLARNHETAAGMLGGGGGASAWKAVTTAEGQTYYVNQNTQETSWEAPASAGGSTDVIATVISMLRTAGDDPEVSKSAYAVLATLCAPNGASGLSRRSSFQNVKSIGARAENTPHTAASTAACTKVLSLGGVDVTQDWLVYNTGKEEHQGAAANALALLASIGRALPQTLDQAVASGTLDTISGAVFAAKKLTPDLLAAYEALMSGTTDGRFDFANDLVTSGRVGQLVGMFNKSGGEKQGDAMRRNPNSARQFLKFAAKLGDEFEDDEGMKEQVNKEGVPQLVMQLMGEHGHDEELTRLGGLALTSLLNPRDAALAAIASLEEMLPGLTPADANAVMLRKIAMQNRMVSNLITIDGVLDASSMARVVGVYSQLLGKLEAIPPSKLRDELINDVIAAMGLMLTDPKFTADPTALAQLMAALDRQCGAGKVVESMEPLLGLAKAGHLKALGVIANHNGISALLQAADLAESRGDQATAAKLRMIVDEIMECVQQNADALRASDLATLLALYSQLPNSMLLANLPTDSPLLLDMILNDMKNGGGSDALMAGWAPVAMPDGRTYYANAATGETAWEKPIDSSAFGLSSLFLAALQGLAANARAGQAMGGLGEHELAPMLNMALKLIAFEPNSDIEKQQHAAALKNLNALLESIAASPAGARAIAASGLVQALLDGLDSPDEGKVKECLELLQKLVGAGAASPELLNALQDAAAAAKLGQLLHANAHNAAVGLATMETLKMVGDVVGSERLIAMGASGKILSDIDVLVTDHGGVNPVIGTVGAALKQMIGESLGSEAALGAGLITITNSMNSCNARLVMGVDGGRAYYAMQDGTTSWDEPPEYSSMMSSLDAFGETAQKNEGAISRVADEILAQMVSMMQAHSDNGAMLCAIGAALTGLCDNDENAAALAALNGIEAIIEALIKNPANVKLLRILVKLLLKFCKHDVFKERVGEARGCYALLLCLSRNCDADLLGTTGDGITSVDELEDGWVEAKTGEGKSYYYHQASGKTVWEKPVKKSGGAAASDNLWKEMTTADGRAYYYHTVTKETSWTKPAEPAAGGGGAQSGLAGRGAENDHDALMHKLISLLANLSYNSESNCARIMARDGVPTLEKAMQTFRYKPTVLEVIFVTFNNLCFVSAENKLAIGRRCGDEIVAVIGDHSKQTKLVTMALKTVGNLTAEDECVEIVIKEGVINAIVAGMHAVQELTSSASDEHLLQLVSIQVVANLASAGIDLDEELLEKDPSAHDRTIAHTIFAEGGAHAILKVASESLDDTNLLLPALKGLECVCEDVQTAAKLAPHGLVDFVISVMQTHDQDPDIIDPSFELAGTLCECAPCAEMLVNQGFLPILLSAMKELSEDVPNLLVNGAIALAHIAALRRFSAQLVSAGVVDALKVFLDDNSQGELGDDETQFLLEALKAIAEIASDAQSRTAVGNKATGSIITVCRRHMRNSEVLESAFKALSILAFDKSNLATIVKLGGINVIMQGIAKNSRAEQLMVRAITTIDFIAMGDPQYSLLVVKCGGKMMISKIQGVYKVRSYARPPTQRQIDSYPIHPLTQHLIISHTFSLLTSRASQLANYNYPSGIARNSSSSNFRTYSNGSSREA
jgi:outer membrane protein assembly factor BamB